MAKEVGELMTIADVVYEVVESSNLSSEDMSYVMSRLCNKIRPDWAMMPFQMIAGTMRASGSDKCTIKFDNKGSVQCELHAPKGKSLNLNTDKKGGKA